MKTSIFKDDEERERLQIITKIDGFNITLSDYDFIIKVLKRLLKEEKE